MFRQAPDASARERQDVVSRNLFCALGGELAYSFAKGEAAPGRVERTWRKRCNPGRSGSLIVWGRGPCGKSTIMRHQMRHPCRYEFWFRRRCFVPRRSRTATGARAARSPASPSLKLGTLHFPNFRKAGCAGPFLRGVALLHSFGSEEAAEQFRAAQKIDPSFAMAYWGEALTNVHPLWGEDDPAAARAVLGRLECRPGGANCQAPTPRERAYGAAVEPCSSRPISDRARRVCGRYATGGQSLSE